jgi:hypothetical protein
VLGRRRGREDRLVDQTVAQLFVKLADGTVFAPQRVAGRIVRLVSGADGIEVEGRADGSRLIEKIVMVYNASRRTEDD